MSKITPAAHAFSRNVLGDGVTTARYDPYSFVLWHRSHAAKLDQVTRLKVYPNLNHLKPDWFGIDLDSVEDSSDMIASFHEKIHWIQFCGTSIGCLLTAITLFQHRWFWLEVPGLSDESRHKLIRQRNAENAIFRVDDQNACDLTLLDEDGKYFAETWWEYGVARAILSGDRNTTSFKNIDLSLIMGRVLGYIAHDSLGLNNREMMFKLMDAFSSPQWNAMDQTKIEITTCQLFEAGAVLSELDLLTTAISAGYYDSGIYNRLLERLEQVEDHAYFKALQIYCRCFNLANIRDVALNEDHRLILKSIIDLALNPIVPPFVSWELSSRLPLNAAFEIKQIFPPLRFLHLCAGAVVLLKQRTFPATFDEIARFERELCYVTNTFSTPHLTEPWAGHQAANLQVLENDPEELHKLSLIGYFCSVQKTFWQLRQEHIGFSTDYLDAVNLDPDPEENERRLLSHYGTAVHPLLQVGLLSKNYGLLPAHGLENLQRHILGLSMFEYVLYDVFANAGPVSLSSFPPDVRQNQSLRTSVLNTLAHFLGREFDLIFANF